MSKRVRENWLLSAGTLILALAVFLLAVQAKRSQYPDSANGNPHLSQLAKMDKRAHRGADFSPVAITPTVLPLVNVLAERRPLESDPEPDERAAFSGPFRLRPPPIA